MRALVVHHLKLVPSDREWLFGILDAPREDTSDSDVADVIERFRSGALGDVLATMNGYERQILEDENLKAHSELHELAAAFIELVKKPIEHLYS